MMITLGRKLCRYWEVLLAVSVFTTACHFSGYAPDCVIPLSGNCPLALMKDGRTLIVGSPGNPQGWGFKGHVVGPIRFLDLANGNEIGPPLEIQDFWAAALAPPYKRDPWEAATISSASLSDDQRRLAVWCDWGDRFNSQVTVFDLSTHSVLFEKAIANPERNNFDPLTYQLSGDGALLAWANPRSFKFENGEVIWSTDKDTDGSIVVWDLDENNERFRVRDRERSAGFQFSPDSKLLVASSVDSPDRCAVQLIDSATGNLLRSVDCPRGAVNGPPVFSPDGRFVALNCMTGEGSRVIDVSSGRQCLHFKGCSPQFLPDLLLGVTDSHLPVTLGPNLYIPAISVWSCGDWSEKRSLVYSLGNSPLTGTIIPNYLPLSRGNKFAVLYGTEDGWWTGSSMASRLPLSAGRFLRKLGFNAPGGLGMDVIDATTGVKTTYHLDCEYSYYTYPQAGKIVCPRSDGTAAVWSIPPPRSFRAIAITAGGLAVIAVLSRLWRILMRRRIQRCLP